MPPVKVMMVDDSATVRRVVGRMLCQDPDIEVVGTAANGQEALDRLPELRPDVVVLDVEMPVLDGLDALKRMMKSQPVPVVMLSAHTRMGSQAALEALSLGAVDFIPKPEENIRLTTVVEELAAKVKTAATVSMKRIVTKVGNKHGLEATSRTIRESFSSTGPRRELVVIGCSTGGPAALQTIVPELPPDLPAGIVVVQHIPAGFTSSLAEYLSKRSAITVKHAVDGDPVFPGQVLIAPAGADLLFRGRPGQLTINLIPREERLHPGVFHPSVDGVMTSAARVCGQKVLGVLLTGMGKDGALGMKEIKKHQGRTIAEAEETCIVFGMPKAAIEVGAVDKVVRLQDMAREIVNEL
ncbi:MAG: chemotaxis response regulator protein-glutamate methylesterase [Bacillota bacterium]